MTARLLHFIFGYRRYSVPSGLSARVTELLRETAVSIHSSGFEEENFTFCVPLSSCKRLERAAAESGIELSLVFERGMPVILWRYRRRAGIAVGLLLASALVFLSGTVIWDIRVDGNSRLSDSEVLSELRDSGLRLGMIRKKINTDVIENTVMIRSDEISWISINIIGTVAEVEIRETLAIEEPSELYDAANVVAAKDGYILLFEESRGNIVAEIGEYVREGELLISGLYDSVTEGFRYTRAKGRVLASTESEISVSVPFEYQKKSYTGRVFTEKYLVFFEKEIKIFGNSGNCPSSCDTIDTVEYFDVLGGGELPVGIRTVKHMEYTETAERRSEDEARKLAERMLSYSLASFAKNAELLSKSTDEAITESGCILKCRVRAIEDIAKIKEIDIS